MGTLFVVATPIGNLEDWSRRAERVVREAGKLYAEDTRHTRTLLVHYGIDAMPRSLYEHNEQARVPEILDALEEGVSVAIVSDAGTPLVSDPGARVVEAAIEAGHRVEAIPGASAVLTALAVSGLPAQPFVFLGFPPRKLGQRRELFERYREREETLVLFEAPGRLARTLGELDEILGPRRACVARELTKVHEEAVRAPLSALADHFAEGARGEIAIVVEGCAEREPMRLSNADDAAAVDARIAELMDEGASVRDSAATLAAETGLPKRELYARVVALRGERG